MGEPKRKGDVAELAVATDLRRRGCRVAFPFGEDWAADLIVERAGSLERMQVKYAESDGAVLQVRCRHQSLTDGRVRVTRRYTQETIEWLAVYDGTTGCCYYIPAAELGDGRSLLHLRLTPPRNGQRAGIRLASEYLCFG